MAADSPITGAGDGLEQALEQGYTLPAEWYTDPAWFQLERRRIFRRSWHYVGHAAQVARPGNFFTSAVDNVSVVVVRDETGMLNAFANVCRHRGSEIVLDRAGNRKTLQCHYHGWTWNLDGTLRAAPRSSEQPDFNKEDVPLIRLRLDTFGPFIFVNLDPEAAPLAQTLGELPQLLAEARVHVDGLQLHERRVYDIKANWKVVVENYLECYHCPIAHPGFTSLIDLDDYDIIPYEFFSIQRGALRSSARERDEEIYSSEGAAQEGIYVYLWPNFMLNSYPGPGMLSLNLMLPLDAGHTRAIFEFYFAENFPESDIAERIAFIDQVQQEDTILCESVQRGLSSGFYRQGKLMLTREHGIQHFQRLVYNALQRGESHPTPWRSSAD